MSLPYEYGINRKGCEVMKMKFGWRKYCVLILMLLFCVTLAGCAGNGAEETDAVETRGETGLQQRLVLSPTQNETGGSVQITPELEGKIGNSELIYCGFSTVTMELDGKPIDLVEAIQDEKITLEEILAYAKIDARNGLCEMKYQSELGYAHYRYIYDRFEILSTYDVFEDIDGTLYHNESVNIGSPGEFANAAWGNPIVVKNGEEIRLGVEDWALTFEIREIRSDGIVLACSQGESQQNGDVELFHYSIYQIDEEGHRQKLQKQGSSGFMEPVHLRENGTTELDLLWQKYGDLPSGVYYLKLSFEDVYTDNNPMVKDYTRFRDYTVSFEIS